jgi:hypothetical protein
MSDIDTMLGQYRIDPAGLRRKIERHARTARNRDMKAALARSWVALAAFLAWRQTRRHSGAAA